MSIIFFYGITSHSAVDWSDFPKREYFFSKIEELRETTKNQKLYPFQTVHPWESIAETLIGEDLPIWSYDPLKKRSAQQKNIAIIYDLYQYIQFLRRSNIGKLVDTPQYLLQIFGKNLGSEWEQEEIAPYITPSFLVNLIMQQWRAIFEENSPECIFFPVSQKLMATTIDANEADQALSILDQSFNQRIESAFWSLMLTKGGPQLGVFLQQQILQNSSMGEWMINESSSKDREFIDAQSKNVVDFLKGHQQLCDVSPEMIRLQRGLYLSLRYDIPSDTEWAIDILLALEGYQEMMGYLQNFSISKRQ